MIIKEFDNDRVMLRKISQEIKSTLTNFSTEDKIIFNNHQIEIAENNFQPLLNNSSDKTIAFIDGGQAEIISTGNFCLSFIRVFSQVFQGNKKVSSEKNEFYLFTKAKWTNEDLYYESKIFPLQEKIVNENDLLISSNDSSIKSGTERAPINKITNMARRFAELSLAANSTADFVVLDGILEPSFKNETQYLAKLGDHVSALAKSSSLFTVSGNSPVVFLNKIGPAGCWTYFVEGKTNFVKLNQQAKHVFRFDGNKTILPHLLQNCQDALFIGYPYGLVFVDKVARVSNVEKKSLTMNLLLREENMGVVDYLTTSNAHEILDNLG